MRICSRQAIAYESAVTRLIISVQDFFRVDKLLNDSSRARRICSELV